MPTDISKLISDAAYNAYERRLLAQVRAAAVPHHVAIIMDGNRRFAREVGLGNPAEGHVKGKDKLEEVLQWCLDVGVKILTVYAFSTENLTRPTEEVKELMRLFAENFRRVGDDERVHKNRIKIQVFGDRDLLPANVLGAIEYAEGRTREYDQYRFNIAVAYGGREEILDAIRYYQQMQQVDGGEVMEVMEAGRAYLYLEGGLAGPGRARVVRTFDPHARHSLVGSSKKRPHPVHRYRHVTTSRIPRSRIFSY